MEKTIGQRLKRLVILFLARRLPPCKTLVPLFSEARERPLTLREKVITKLHLFTCEACRRYVAQIERIGEMVKPKDEEEIAAAAAPADQLSDSARTRIRAVLQTAARDKHRK